MRGRWAGRPMAVSYDRCNTGLRVNLGAHATRRRGLGGRIAGGQATRRRVEDLLDTDEARSLCEAGRETGSVTAEEIALAFDELELEPGQLDELYQALEEAHIEIVASADEADDSEAEDHALEASTDALQL